MRLLLLSAILSTISSTLAQYPTCAQSCVNDVTAITNAGCLTTDGYCQCTSTSYLESATCCIRANCDVTDQNTAFAQAVYVCSTYGVTLQTDASFSCSAATTSASVASAATSSAVSYHSSKPHSYKVPKNKKKGLTSGAKGGIGAAVALIILGISTLAGFILKRRNAKKGAAAASAPDQAGEVPGAVAGYPDKENTTVEVNPVPSPAPQYPAQGGQYAPPPSFQSEGQYPQPVYAPQPQYSTAPQEQQYAQYGQAPQPQYSTAPQEQPYAQYGQAPPQQYQQQAYAPGPEMQVSPIGQQPPQQFQQPPQQYQQPAYTPGPETHISPIGHQPPPQAFPSAEPSGNGAGQPKHEAP